MTKTQSQPVPNGAQPNPPQAITVTMRVTVPIVAYGNLSFEATQEINFVHVDGGTEALERHMQTVTALELLQRSIAEVILPMVEAEVVRYSPILLKEANPSSWLARNSTAYMWFRIAYPDIEIPAMNAILAARSVPNSALE